MYASIRHRQGQKVEGQGRMKILHKNMKYMCLTSSDREIYPSYSKSKSPERMAWSDFCPEAPK